MTSRRTPARNNSPRKKHCYAETFAERFRGVKGHPYEQGFDLRLVPEKATGLPKPAKQQALKALPKLTDVEQELLSHMEQGYQLETDSLGGDPLLRSLKDDEVIRPLSANRNTVRALDERGLITRRL